MNRGSTHDTTSLYLHLTFTFIIKIILCLHHINPKSTSIMSVEETVAKFKEGHAEYFETAYGYAVFPDISSGSFILGKKSGDGEIYIGGEMVGTVHYSETIIGGIGKESFSQIIFFKDEEAWEKFQGDNVKKSFGGQNKATVGNASIGTAVSNMGASAHANNHVATSYIKGFKIVTQESKGFYLSGKDGDLTFGHYKFTPKDAPKDDKE